MLHSAAPPPRRSPGGPGMPGRTAPPCHAERSEASGCPTSQTLRCTQGDTCGLERGRTGRPLVMLSEAKHLAAALLRPSSPSQRKYQPGDIQKGCMYMHDHIQDGMSEATRLTRAGRLA